MTFCNLDQSNATERKMEPQQESLRPVQLFSVGPFGKAVARYLELFRSDLLNTSLVEGLTPNLEVRHPARAMVVAAWRPVPNLCALLEEFSYQRQVPWLPLILEFNVLRLGPIVVPGLSCWSCWEKRYRQHLAWPIEISILLQHYASHANDGPRGY